MIICLNLIGLIMKCFFNSMHFLWFTRKKRALYIYISCTLLTHVFYSILIFNLQVILTNDFIFKVKEALDVYTKAFQTLKGNRTLEWNTGLGFVQINVELGRCIIIFWKRSRSLTYYKNVYNARPR